MAIRKTRLVQKAVNHRGLYTGKEQSVTSHYKVAEGVAFPTTDVLYAVPLGENVRLDRIVIRAIPTRGTPVLTGATFNVGVAPVRATNFTRPDGTAFPPPAVAASILSAAAAIDVDNMFTDIEVPRPVADSVTNYGPYYVTITPTAAFSVAGGDIDLQVTVEFVGEENLNEVFSGGFVSSKVNN